jgi:hypothetical protein
MKYAKIDSNGVPIGFYSDDIHSSIPEYTIAITEEQWLECINNQGQRAFVNGGLVEYTHQLTEQETTAQKVQEAISFLNSTEYKFNDDYDRKETAEWLELKTKRQEARELIRSIEAE